MKTEHLADSSAPAAGAAGNTMKLAFTVADAQAGEWVAALDFAAAGIAPVFLHSANVPPPRADFPRHPIRHQTSAGGSIELPDFGEIVRALEEADPAACFIGGGGPFARLVTVAADLLGVPVFSLVTDERQLSNLGPRSKPRPDLSFLADAELFPAALLDRRYGSTLLPSGHPGRDLFLRGLEIEPHFGEERFGDGQAGARILAAIDRWRCGRLDPAEPDVSIVVPAFNEAENLPMVCDRLLETFEHEAIVPEILLVDDVSEDGTYRVALGQMWRSPRIRAFTKPLPRGMGNAIRQGLRYARAPIVAVTMGDGSDEVRRIPEMYRRVRSGEAALAIGSRYRHRRNYENVPRLYRFWSFCFRLAARALTGLKLRDYTNSFRVYHRDVFRRYGPESGGFEISPETTFKAWFATRRVAEVDVRHLKRASGQSSFSFLRAGPGYGKILFKAFVNRLTGKWFTLDW